MTTRLALILFALILGFFCLDYLVLGLDAPLFLARKFADLVDWLSFWR